MSWVKQFATGKLILELEYLLVFVYMQTHFSSFPFVVYVILMSICKYIHTRMYPNCLVSRIVEVLLISIDPTTKRHGPLHTGMYIFTYLHGIFAFSLILTVNSYCCGSSSLNTICPWPMLRDGESAASLSS